MYNRAGNERAGSKLMNLPVAASTQIQPATLVVLNASGYAVPAAKAENLIAAGVAQKFCDNTGSDGAETVEVKRGAFVFNNDGSVKNTDLLKTAYMVDSTTVTITATGSSAVGKIIEVQDDGITVEIA